MQSNRNNANLPLYREIRTIFLLVNSKSDNLLVAPRARAGNKEKDRESRIAIERMLIRDLAGLLQNDQIDTLNISDYRLANERIDRR